MYEIKTRDIIKLDDDILKKYADVMVKFCLNENKGCQPGDVVRLSVPELASPMLPFLIKSVLECGGHPLTKLIPEGTSKVFYENATDEQLEYTDDGVSEAFVNQIDHTISVICDGDKFELKDIAPEKIMKSATSAKYIRTLLNKKECNGSFSWSLCLYPNLSDVEETGVDINDYIENLIESCYLNEDDPIAKLREVNVELNGNADYLNNLKIKKVHIIDDNGTDLHIGLPEKYKFKSNISHNIPSYECFCSPDWRTVTGTYVVTEPLYRSGNLITDIKLKFENGICVDSSASKGEDFLKELIAVENGDKVGELAFTSNISPVKPGIYSDTLFQENLGASMHIAIGTSYKDCYTGDTSLVTDDEWKDMGYNESTVHTDIVAYGNRTVIATLESGEEVLIYKDGEFQI